MSQQTKAKKNSMCHTNVCYRLYYNVDTYAKAGTGDNSVSMDQDT